MLAPSSTRNYAGNRLPAGWRGEAVRGHGQHGFAGTPAPCAAIRPQSQMAFFGRTRQSSPHPLTVGCVTSILNFGIPNWDPKYVTSPTPAPAPPDPASDLGPDISPHSSTRMSVHRTPNAPTSRPATNCISQLPAFFLSLKEKLCLFEIPNPLSRKPQHYMLTPQAPRTACNGAPRSAGKCSSSCWSSCP